MAAKYNVYLSKLSTDPDIWDGANEGAFDHANGWVKIICAPLEDSFAQGNKAMHMAAHTSFRLVTGEFKQAVVLKNVIITNTGNTQGSNYYNAFKKFLLKHAMTGASASHKYKLYLHVYNVGGGGKWLEWMDDSGDMKDHCQVMVKAFKFTVDHAGNWRGNIQLQEVWDS